MRSCRSNAAKIRATAARIRGSKNGSLSELRRGRKKPWTSSGLRNPFLKSNRAMHSEPQISPHEMAPPFRFSHGGRIHRCCTAQFSRCALRDKVAMQMAVDQHLHACVLERSGVPGETWPYSSLIHTLRNPLCSPRPNKSTLPSGNGRILKILEENRGRPGR